MHFAKLLALNLKCQIYQNLQISFQEGRLRVENPFSQWWINQILKLSQPSWLCSRQAMLGIKIGLYTDWSINRDSNIYLPWSRSGWLLRCDSETDVMIAQQFYLSDMAYVQQVCEGYSKRSLMGNWMEERLYPPQPFRENISKQPRPKDEAITTFDGTSFQRALPRLDRRPKWDTHNRIVLDDGIKNAPSVMRAEFPHNEQQSSYGEMRRPFDKNSASVGGSSTHPHSEVKPNQAPYRIVDPKNSQEIRGQREVLMYGSDFKSTLPQHPAVEKFTNYTSEYKGRISGQNDPLRTRTVSQFMQTRQAAGNNRQVYPEQTVKPITTLFCENKKEEGDEKERTGVQRSWVPSRDKALSYSTGRTAEEFKRAGEVRNDIQTNLNINVGLHRLHPQEIPENYFRHTRTITVNHNKNPTSRP